MRVLSEEIANLTTRSGNAIAYYAAQRAGEVQSLVSRMERHLPDTATHRQRVDELLERAYMPVSTRSSAFAGSRPDSLRTTLAALDPSAILRRGYAMVTSLRDGRALTSARQRRPG